MANTDPLTTGSNRMATPVSFAATGPENASSDEIRAILRAAAGRVRGIVPPAAAGIIESVLYARKMAQAEREIEEALEEQRAVVAQVAAGERVSLRMAEILRDPPDIQVRQRPPAPLPAPPAPAAPSFAPVKRRITALPD